MSENALKTVTQAQKLLQNLLDATVFEATGEGE